MKPAKVKYLALSLSLFAIYRAYIFCFYFLPFRFSFICCFRLNNLLLCSFQSLLVQVSIPVTTSFCCHESVFMSGFQWSYLLPFFFFLPSLGLYLGLLLGEILRKFWTNISSTDHCSLAGITSGTHKWPWSGKDYFIWSVSSHRKIYINNLCYVRIPYQLLRFLAKY